jgi:hypothetical protein
MTRFRILAYGSIAPGKQNFLTDSNAPLQKLQLQVERLERDRQSLTTKKSNSGNRTAL